MEKLFYIVGLPSGQIIEVNNLELIKLISKDFIKWSDSDDCYIFTDVNYNKIIQFLNDLLVK